MWVAADDSAEVRLNGTLVMSTPPTSASLSTVTTANVPGTSGASINVAPIPNTIEIKVRNGQNPSTNPPCPDQYQCNPAGVVFGASFSDALAQLPECPPPVPPHPNPNRPGGEYLAGDEEIVACPPGQVDQPGRERYRPCRCSYDPTSNPSNPRSVGYWDSWVNTCVTPVRKRACVGFDPPFLVNTEYGAPAMQPPGYPAILSSGITGYLENFLTGVSTQFNKASIESVLVPSGTGQSLRLTNISIRFDFSALNFRPSTVTFLFREQGPTINIATNASPAYVGNISKIPAAVGSAGAAVTSTPTSPPSPRGSVGTVTLSGAIQTLLIGGQELWIDEVCAVE